MTNGRKKLSGSAANPGSREAGEQGCVCPVMDNWRGDPEIGRIRGFVVVQGCPLHDLAAQADLRRRDAEIMAEMVQEDPA